MKHKIKHKTSCESTYFFLKQTPHVGHKYCRCTSSAFSSLLTFTGLFTLLEQFFMCKIQLFFLTNEVLHSEQEYGLSSVCTRRWHLNDNFGKILLHIGQLYFSTTRPFFWTSGNTLIDSPCRTLWYNNSDWEAVVKGHRWHLLDSSFPSVKLQDLERKCTERSWGMMKVLPQWGQLKWNKT